MRLRRLIVSLSVGMAVAWGMLLAPLQRPRQSFAPEMAMDPWQTRFFFSPDSKHLVTVQVTSVQNGTTPLGNASLWDVSAGVRLAALTENEPLVNSVAFAPDGTRIAGRCLDGKILEWKRATGSLFRTYWHDFHKNSGLEAQLSYTDGGQLLFQHWLQLRDVDSNDLIRSFLDNTGSYLNLSQRFQGFLVAVREDHSGVVVGLADGSCREIPCAKSLAVLSDGALSPDGRTIAVRPSKESLPRSRPVTVTSPHGQFLVQNTWMTTNLCLANDGIMLSQLAADHPRKWWFFGDQVHVHRIEVIDVATDQIVGSIKDGIKSEFSPDNRTLAVVLENGTIQLWDLPLRKPWTLIAFIAFGAAAIMFLLLTWRAGRRQSRIGNPPMSITQDDRRYESASGATEPDRGG